MAFFLFALLFYVFPFLFMNFTLIFSLFFLLSIAFSALPPSPAASLPLSSTSVDKDHERPREGKREESSRGGRAGVFVLMDGEESVIVLTP